MAITTLVQGDVEPVLKSVDQTVVWGLGQAGPVAELSFAVFLLVIVIAVHGWCLGTISKSFAIRISRFTQATRDWRYTFLMGTTVALMAITHLTETLIWMAPIWKLGLIPDPRDAYFFVLEAYTTLGEGVVSLPYAWRLIGPVIAISGLFTFSWTGSVLVYVMTETGRRRAAAANHAVAEDKDATKRTEGTSI